MINRYPVKRSESSIHSATRQLFHPAASISRFHELCRVIARFFKDDIFLRERMAESISPTSYSCDRRLKNTGRRRRSNFSIRRNQQSQDRAIEQDCEPSYKTCNFLFSLFIFVASRREWEIFSLSLSLSIWFSNPFSAWDILFRLYVGSSSVRILPRCTIFSFQPFDKSIIYHEQEISLSFSHSIVLSRILSPVDRQADFRERLSCFPSGNNPSSDCTVLFFPRFVLF